MGIFDNLPQDESTKDYEINLSGLRAFGNIIEYTKNYKGRKIGFTSRSKKNRKKVFFNIIQPSAGDTDRVPARNPVGLFLESKEAEEIVKEFGEDLLDVAMSTAFGVTSASKTKGAKGSYAATGVGRKAVRDVFKKTGDKIKAAIQNEFSNVEPPKVKRLEKSTVGLTETGKLKRSIGNRIYGKAFPPGHFSKKRRQRKRKV